MNIFLTSGRTEMLTSQMTHKIDAGRLMIVPLFTLLLIVNILGIHNDVKELELLSTIKVATLVHRLLVVCFYALFVLLYLMRRSARATTNSFAAKIIAVVATFIPFAFPVLSRPINNLDIMLFADVVMIFGMAITLCSLSVLGRSVSIIPQARSLVQRGPYRIVRHPLYLGELIAILGIVMARFSLSAMSLFCLLTALQIYRAMQEERLLAGTFPEYKSYSLKRARFIPGIY